MEIKPYYKVDLKYRNTWNSDFIKDCKKNNFIFKVQKMVDEWQVVLYKNENSEEYGIWTHDVAYGEFIDAPLPLNITIDERLFEI